MTGSFTRQWKAETLEFHLTLGREKSVSYLPIGTVEKHLGLSTSEYLALIEKSGHRGVALGPDLCRIANGAVYAFSETDLDALLRSSRDILLRCGWPVTPEAFVRRVAAEWVEEGELLGVIRQAFGDPDRGSR